VAGAASERRKRRKPALLPSPGIADEIRLPAVALSGRAGCLHGAVWALAIASYLCVAGYSASIDSAGVRTTDSYVYPYGLVFVLPCLLLTYANRERVTRPWVPALLSLGAVALGVIEIATGWVPVGPAAMR
jgi:hypothetical protein